MSARRRLARRPVHPLAQFWRGPAGLLWSCEGELRWRIRTRQRPEPRHRADHAAGLVAIARRKLANRWGPWYRGGTARIE